MIVLYTGAGAAGAEAAGELGERLRRAGTTLAVVTTGATTTYWAEAATTRTGGPVIRSAERQGIEAFDALAEALRARYVVRVARPAAGIGQVTLTVEVGGSPVTVDVTLSPDAVAPVVPDVDGPRGWVWWPAAAALLLAGLLIGVLSAILLRRNRDRADIRRLQPGQVVAVPVGTTAQAPGPATDPEPQVEPADPEPPDPEPPDPEPADPELAETEAGYRARLRLIEEQVEREPANPEHRRRLATAHQGMADVDRDQGRMALADAGYRRALDALQARVALDPANPGYRRDLAVALTRLAVLDAAQGWPAQAGAGVRRAIEIHEWLLKADPDDAGDQEQLQAARTFLAALEDRIDDDQGGAGR